MSDKKDLIWFNKEGDYLNFNYNEYNNRYEGDILFNESSSDTFKTQALYMFEHVPSFEFEAPGELTTDKFQLFNEWGFHFFNGNYVNELISKIEPVNSDSNFYSKWIYGIDFDIKFKIGTLITFNDSIFEFNDPKKSYVVVGNKKNAIMVLSSMDNASFELLQSNIVENYVDKKISSINAIGIYNYIDSNYNNNLSKWSEPNFYDKFYNKRKLNVIGTKYNDGVYTVKDVEISDPTHFEYELKPSDFNDGDKIIMEVITKTDLPLLYNGVLIIDSDKITFPNSNLMPDVLKPGMEIKIIGSLNNTNFITLKSLIEFKTIVNTTIFNIGDQVLFNNKIYQCVFGYTHDFSSSTSTVTPDNKTYWKLADHIKVDQTLFVETISAQIYLTSDRYYFEEEFNYSKESTLKIIADKYNLDLSIFNIDLYYSNYKLKADLKYASQYGVVNFYKNSVNPSNKIGHIVKTNERLVEVVETLNYEMNYDISSNYKYNITFTDIDEYGIKVHVNGMVYDESVEWIYSGLSLDMERTIDQTLRNWYLKYYLRLISLGIECELDYLGNFTSPYYNSIILKTYYPNVDLEINKIEVGTTANYFIEHSSVLFKNIGPVLNIKIKGKELIVKSIVNGGIVDVAQTLNEWYETYFEYLETFGIHVVNTNTILKFNVKELDTPLNYTINVNLTQIPGQEDFIITNKIKGNLGALITSNEIILPSGASETFIDNGFATGMVISLNNTFYPFMNTGFNIQHLNDNVLNLSYQGPFWALTSSICSASPFINLAFNGGFGQTGCSPSFVLTGGTGGPYNMIEYNDTQFSPIKNLNNYELTNIDGISGMIDIIYTQISNSFYVFGDNVRSYDSETNELKTTISLIGNSNPIKMVYNNVNNYLYCLSKNILWIIDPISDNLIQTTTLLNDAYDISINELNGDIYISYTNSIYLDIYNLNNTLQTQLNTGSNVRNGGLVFNDSLGDMFVTTDNDNLLQIDGNLRAIQNTYNLTGLKFDIFYESANEIIFIYDNTDLYKLDNGILSVVSTIQSTPFTDLLFNNISGKINISNNNSFNVLNYDNTNIQVGVPGYGYLEINQYDECVYLSSQNLNTVYIIDKDGNIVHQEAFSGNTTQLVYNPKRKSILLLQPSTNKIIEMKVNLVNELELTTITYSQVDDNQYGTLDKNYVKKNYIWLKSDDFIRKPRENFENEVGVEYYWKWVDDTSSEFFLYDFSGEQLETTGSYVYIGVKPLDKITLNDKPNRIISRNDKSQYQQTIFDKITYPISYINDEDDFSAHPKPLELFIGFNANDEGAFTRELKLFKKEQVTFDHISNDDNYLIVKEESDRDGNRWVSITLNTSTDNTFLEKGLKKDQIVSLSFKDNTNIDFNQYISLNNGFVLKIREVYFKTIILDYMNPNQTISYEKTIIDDYPKTNSKSYIKTSINVLDKEIANFNVYGQCEIEDIRFKTELNNIGKNIDHDDIFIFKHYDIHEGGIDWNFLNVKRKEMLMMKHLIFPYIGSYKSIINAINFFGYNDLELNEYYKNIDPNSENFLKLFKIEIPNIFDNTIEGWDESDFINSKYSTDSFEDTKLFNLTYNITNKDGDNILEYSTDDVIIKLEGLKYWLQKKIIPLTHKILDITGRSYFNADMTIKHKMSTIKSYVTKDEMTPITGKLNSAYLMPVNSGSTVYNCVLDFYTIIEGVGTDKTLSGLITPATPRYDADLTLPDTFNIKIRTYKTYKEWNPYTTYSKGDNIIYYSKIYTSLVNDNKLNNPRKYDTILEWSSTSTYNTGDIVRYENDYYSSKNESLLNDTNPYLDNFNWLNITKWKEINYEPVQTFKEFRTSDNLTPYNFTIDSNIDPFITIEITSDNGYGCNYNDRKNYELRGLKDLTDEYKTLEPIGPFQPIIFKD